MSLPVECGGSAIGSSQRLGLLSASLSSVDDGMTEKKEDKPFEMPPLDQQARHDNVVHDTHTLRKHFELGNSKISQIL